MDAALWGFIGTVLGAAVGASASVATTVIASKNAAGLQAQADSLERSERSRAFQRDNLLATQEALQSVGRLVSRAFHHDVMACRSGGVWATTLLPAELDESLGDSNRCLAALMQRIADDSLREQLRQVHSDLTLVTMSASREEADARMTASTVAFDRVMTHLGQVLRSNY